MLKLTLKSDYTDDDKLNKIVDNLYLISLRNYQLS